MTFSASGMELWRKPWVAVTTKTRLGACAEARTDERTTRLRTPALLKRNEPDTFFIVEMLLHMAGHVSDWPDRDAIHLEGFYTRSRLLWNDKGQTRRLPDPVRQLPLSGN
jgi:hypothetical protein